jgi:hypothetical protein
MGICTGWRLALILGKTWRYTVLGLVDFVLLLEKMGRIRCYNREQINEKSLAQTQVAYPQVHK